MTKSDDDIIVCRCEEVTLGDIRRCIAKGCRTVNEIKHETRAGMGPCQGRTCRMLIAQELSRALHVPIEEIELPVYRVPIEPIPIEALADAAAEDRKES